MYKCIIGHTCATACYIVAHVQIKWEEIATDRT